MNKCESLFAFQKTSSTGRGDGPSWSDRCTSSLIPEVKLIAHVIEKSPSTFTWKTKTVAKMPSDLRL